MAADRKPADGSGLKPADLRAPSKLLEALQLCSLSRVEFQGGVPTGSSLASVALRVLPPGGTNLVHAPDISI